MEGRKTAPESSRRGRRGSRSRSRSRSSSSSSSSQEGVSTEVFVARDSILPTQRNIESITLCGDDPPPGVEDPRFLLSQLPTNSAERQLLQATLSLAGDAERVAYTNFADAQRANESEGCREGTQCCGGNANVAMRRHLNTNDRSSRGAQVVPDQNHDFQVGERARPILARYAPWMGRLIHANNFPQQLSRLVVANVGEAGAVAEVESIDAINSASRLNHAYSRILGDENAETAVFFTPPRRRTGEMGLENALYRIPLRTRLRHALYDPDVRTPTRISQAPESEKWRAFVAVVNGGSGVESWLDANTQEGDVIVEVLDGWQGSAPAKGTRFHHLSCEFIGAVTGMRPRGMGQKLRNAVRAYNAAKEGGGGGETVMN